jgi:hypothetical protein
VGRVVRLLTVAELDEGGTGDLSVSVRHEAVLNDGRRMVLLHDRGWTQSALVARDARAAAPVLSEEDIVETARQVVGPDEVFGGYTKTEVDAAHWRTLAEKLAAQGVTADPDVLRRLPHEVEFGEKLRARLGRPA